MRWADIDEDWWTVTTAKNGMSHRVPLSPVPMWLLTLIAVELGDLQDHEAVATGYGRAVGYEDVRSFRAGLASGEAGERHRDAVMTMLERSHSEA